MKHLIWKPHIIFISGSHIWSMGAAKGASSFYQTVRHYALAGWDVDLIIGNNADGLDLPGIKIHQWFPRYLLSLGGFRIVGTIAKLMYLSTFSLYALIRISLISKNNHRTVLYGYEIHGIPAGWLARSIFGLKFIARFQGTILHPVMATKFWRLRYWDHYLAMRLPADLTIMANDGTLGDAVIKNIRPSTNLRFWLNGVSLPEPTPKRNSSKMHACDGAIGHECEYSIITSSRLVPWKRVDRIICAMPEIIKTLPRTQLIVLGDGPEMDKLVLLADKLAVLDNIDFMGAVNQLDVAKYLANADLFVSLYDLSNVGNPLLEAMCLGVPILALNSGGTESIVKNGYNGVLIGYEELTTLAAIVTSLLNDAEMRARLAINAKHFAKCNLEDWDQRMVREEGEVIRLLSPLRREEDAK